MERVSWTDKITNEEILNKVREKRQTSVIRNGKKNRIGQELRGEGLLREVMEGRMEGKRARGRRRKWMSNELMVELYCNMKRKAETGMNGGIGCHGPADRQNTEEREVSFNGFCTVVAIIGSGITILLIYRSNQRAA